MKKPCEKHLYESKAELKAAGLKITSTRLGLLDVLKHAKKPLSIKEIARGLGKQGADLVTLYRNVESLENLGAVKQINLKGRQSYFELSRGQHHHHLICMRCGKIEDIQIKEINLNGAFLKKHGFAKITDHSMEFFGLCANCGK